MRNLVASHVTTATWDGQFTRVHLFCVDVEQLCVWVVVDEDLYRVDTEGKERFTNVAPLSSHMTSGDLVVAMEFVADLESVCLALSNGDVLMYNIVSCDLDCVGGVDAGLTGMSWSPDQEVVVLVTKDDKLVMMTLNFDPITETALHPDEFGEAQPVTVGWGKKETQFHGSQGKPKPQQAEKKPVSPAASWDDRRPRISWRGDGECFVSSCIDPVTNTRRIRVWNRMCVLQSTSDGLDGLGQCLNWRPSGNLIASSQMKPHRQDIVFFERNGLQHGEFPLSEGAGLVREVCWNSDSSVLAVLLASMDRPHNASHTTRVQLWTVGNYHWYLKQELHIDRTKKTTPSGDLVGIIWDPAKSLRLHVLTADGNYFCYNWCWSVATSHTHSPRNSAPVAVIDGCNILLTQFRHSVVPPPMAAHTLTLLISVTSVTFAPPPLNDHFLALLASDQIAVFGCEEGDKEGLPRDAHGFRQLRESPRLVGVATLGVHSARCVTWWKPDKLLAIGIKDEKEVLMEFNLSLGSEVRISMRCSVPTPSPVFSLCTNPNTDTAVAQLADGKGLLWIPLDDEGRGLSLEPCERGGLEWAVGQTCEQIALAVIKEKEYVVGLNEFSRALYVGNTKVTSGCTSFAIHNEFLLLTTTSHLLRFINLNSDPRALPEVTETTAQDETVRRVERGSKLVSVVSHDSRVVLQMPRGNLETIHPRALVLSTVRRHLDRLEFKSAFLTMRKHRINLNLIHDHNPQVFLDHVREFVSQLESVTHINLFLTELKEEDVTITMYPKPTCWDCVAGDSRDGGVAGDPRDSGVAGDPRDGGVAGDPREGGMTGDSRDGGVAGDPREGSVGSRTNKVDRVCETLRGVLVAMGTNKYLLSIITTHIRETTPNLEAVLTILKQLKVNSDPSLSVQVDEAIKYTVFLVDVNELYNVALGMYDFDLVLLVAEKSQKDPKEYLPFLNELRKLPVDYRRYKIDVYLRRFEKALQHISRCGTEKFPECLALIKDHTLFSQALLLYRDSSSNEYKEVARSYGSHLRDKERHREAGLIYSQCGELEEALKSFERAGDWRAVFSLSAQLSHSSQEQAIIARRVANSLKSARRFTEAAQVLLDYIQDVEGGVVTLLEGGCWVESVRVAYLHSKPELIESHVKPGVVEALSSRMALFEGLETTFTQHSARLAVVRRLKREKERAIMEGTYLADEKDADLFSDTSSITGRSSVSSLNSSVMSRASGRTSKSRRKADRKKHSLRKGSAHEDLALIEALSETVVTVDRLQDEVPDLLNMLVMFGLMDEGRILQAGFDRLMGVVKSKMKEVWSVDDGRVLESKESAVQGLTGPGATVNSIVAGLQSSALASSSVGSSTLSAPLLRDNVRWKLDILSQL